MIRKMEVRTMTKKMENKVIENTAEEIKITEPNPLETNFQILPLEIQVSYVSSETEEKIEEALHKASIEMNEMSEEIDSLPRMEAHRRRMEISLFAHPAGRNLVVRKDTMEAIYPLFLNLTRLYHICIPGVTVVLIETNASHVPA